MPHTIAQILPALESGGVERGTIEIADAIVRAGHHSIVISGGGGLVSALVENGSRHITLPAGNKSVLVLLCIKRLANIIRAESIDILHARSRLPAWIAWLAIRSLPGEKRPVFITTVHGSYSVNQYSKIMLYGDHIIAPSQYIHEYISTNYPDTDMGRVHTIPRGVSRREFPYGYVPPATWLEKWQQLFPSRDRRFIITLPGRLTRLKGHEDFIKIIKRTREMGVPAHGLVVGGAARSKLSYQNEIFNMTREYCLEEHITFLGKRDDLREIMSVSDVVMSLSKTPEAFGRTVLESLSLGTPVIAYQHGGIAEIMSAMFPEGQICSNNPEDCVEKLVAFYKKTPAVKDVNIFTLEAMQKKTIKLYESCMS